MNTTPHQRIDIQKAPLSQRTLLYWHLSMAYNRRESMCKNISVENAISILTDLEEFTGRSPKLKDHVSTLLDDIIGHVRKPNKTKNDSGTDGPSVA